MVEYENGKKDYIQLSIKRGYNPWFTENYDSDSEGAKERAELEYQKQCDEEMEKHYSSKVLYEDGKWIISSEDKIEHYEGLIKNKNGIKKILKETGAS